MKKKPQVLVIVGATASGKTSIAIDVAKKLDGEIVSADSMQIYKKMRIGTARPTEKEMESIPHHFVGCVYPDEDFSVSDFVFQAQKCIENIVHRGKQPIVTGGTGLYINGLTLPWDFEEDSHNIQVREDLEKRLDEKGSEVLYQELCKADPETAKVLHPNNHKRVIRALEIYIVSGRPKSYWDEKAKNKSLPFDYVMTGLKWNREKLYERINHRVDLMIEQGLMNEVKELLAEGYDRNLTALQAIGVKECFPYLDGKETLEETTRILKRDTRHFAKRQLTWFRKDHRIKWFEPEAFVSTDALGTAISNYFRDSI